MHSDPRSVENNSVDLDSMFRLLELADYIIPFTIRTIVGLGVSDQLIAGPRSVEDVAAAIGVHAPSLHRALRALACKGIFTEIRPGYFSLTPMAELLRTDHPLSLRDVCSLPVADIQAWCRFDYSVRTGDVAFDRVHGEHYWDYLASRPDENAQFGNAMAAWSRLELLAVADAYDWGNIGTVADVGGGNGAFLAGLLARHAGMRGILFDQTHVVASAEEVMRSVGVSDRCEILGGDFFELAPAGADAYVLKRIVYSWNDERAAQLLSNIRSVLPPDGRVLILEPVRREGNAFEVGKLLDLQMLVLGGYRVRDRGELRQVLARACLHLTRVIPTPMIAIVEARSL